MAVIPQHETIPTASIQEAIGWQPVGDTARNWSPLWVIYTPKDVLLSKYDPFHSFCGVPLGDPRLLDILEKVLTHLGFPVRFDA
jgi:hypothetical protein